MAKAKTRRGRPHGSGSAKDGASGWLFPIGLAPTLTIYCGKHAMSPRDEWGAARVEDIARPKPDMAVLRLHRRPPPLFPLDVVGSQWAEWVAAAADAAACPCDYVMSPLLASASVLIGNARWPQAT